jgi:DNA-binding MarR family transcriptional regulator
VHSRFDRDYLSSSGSSSLAELRRSHQPPSPAQREVLREDATRIQFSRGLRRKLFEPNMFGEPAWDMLLALYIIDNDQRRLGTGELARLAGVALTTCLRWLDYLNEQDLIWRVPSTLDQRIVSVELSEIGRAAMDDYLMEVRSSAVFGI